MAAISRPRQEDLKALEQTRQRLYQLTNNIASLKNSILTQSPLPPWSSLQITSSILAGNMGEISRHLSIHHDLFSQLVVYPQPNFPGRTQEGLLGQLLRKKLEPHVEDWVNSGKEEEGLGDDDGLEDLWKFAREWSGERIAHYALEEQGDNYTAEEREMGIENVNTGLKETEESDSDEDEDEDDAMEGLEGGSQPKKTKQAKKEMDAAKVATGKGRTMDEILGFIATGKTAEERNKAMGMRR